jgi:branched-chain amino acid aminotransferase/4-amino-4-deoxychorismate lyase
MIPPDDRGLTLGDGLFETLLARDGRLVAPGPHLERLAAGCGVLGLPAPDRAKALALMEQALSVAGLASGRAAVRLTLTAGSGGRGLDRPAAIQPRLFATAALSPRPTGPVHLTMSTVRRNAGSPASRLKTLAYLDNVLARRDAIAAGADEAVMLNAQGELACAAAANLFWVRDGRLFTPALDCGVLAGTMRAAVMAEAERLGVLVEEARAGPEALSGAEGVFLTNSLIGVRAAASLDGRAVAASWLADQLDRALST